MSLVDPSAEVRIEKLDDMIAESKSEPRRFELNRAHFTPAFPIEWPPLGEITVKHQLVRPTPTQETDFKKMMFSQERITNSGKIIDEGTDLNTARHWLWDQIARNAFGYPGLNSDNGWIELTPELKTDMRSTDKETAIQMLFACQASIIKEKSMRTFTGGEWAVRLRLGTPGAFYASMILRFKEWGQKQKDRFEKSANAGEAEFQGKTKLVTNAVNQSAFRNLFKATLIDVAADPEGNHDLITVDGETFSPANRDKFADAFLGEWQVDVITELAQVWRGK
jgi:hypothetical protein